MIYSSLYKTIFIFFYVYCLHYDEEVFNKLLS